MEKFTKLPYPTSSSRVTQPFDLVHLDIWGPYKIPSRTNHEYFFNIVDDHSRVTWIHLLKYKSNAFSIIKIFANMVTAQFNKKIKVIRSNNACSGI